MTPSNAPNPLLVDPTRTSMTRGRILSFVRGLFKSLNGRVPEILPVDQFPAVPLAVPAFGQRLRRLAEEAVLNPFVSLINGNAAVEGVVRKGMERSYEDVKPDTSGGWGRSPFFLGGREAAVRELLSSPACLGHVEVLKSRAAVDAENAVSAVVASCVRDVSDRAAAGETNVPGSAVVHQITRVGLRRFELLVNSEAVRWYTTGQLLMLEKLGTKDVKAAPERRDGRTPCASCAKLTSPVSLGRAWGVLPYHAGCACAWKPA